MVAEGYHLPEDQAKPRQQEQSQNKEHKAKKSEAYCINASATIFQKTRQGQDKTTGAKPQQRTQSKGKGLLLDKWLSKATIFQKTRQSRDNGSKASTTNTKQRKRSVIK